MKGRPAYAHAPDEALRSAVTLGEQLIAEAADLIELDRQSLLWRGKHPKSSLRG